MDSSTENMSSRPVFAETRAALCETLLDFNQHQQGVAVTQFNGLNVISGLLVDNFGGEDTVFLPTAAVSRLASTPSSATFSQRRILANNSQRTQRPIVLILGRKYLEKIDAVSTMPNKARYVVAGHWIITNVWSAPGNGNINLYVRLQHVAKDGEELLRPFRSKIEENLASDEMSQREPASETCQSCKVSTPRIYAEQWMCGNIDCTNNLGKNHSNETLPDSRRILSSFLIPQESEDGLVNQGETAPELRVAQKQTFTLSDDRNRNSELFRDLWRGEICARCRACNSFRYYNRFQCERCDLTREVNPPIVPLQYHLDDDACRTPSSTDTQLPLCSVPSEASGCVNIIPPKEGKNHWIYRFGLLEGNEIIILRPKPVHRTIKNGVDDMYNELQQLKDNGSVDLARKAIGKHTSRHMVAKYGKEYYAVYGTGTIGFEDCPPLIERMRDYVVGTLREELETPAKFNEAVLCSYLNDMAMSAHSDSEEGLGPYVSSLSLGGATGMAFFMKPEFEAGKYVNNTLVENNPILPGCQSHEQLAALRKDVEEGRLNDEDYVDKTREIVAKHKVRGPRSPLRILEFSHQHGDIVFQKGAGVQEFYLHSIKNLKGLVRDSLTLRYISDDHKPARRRRSRKEPTQEEDTGKTEEQPAPKRAKTAA
ncbi:hypothetical protein F5B20DRAFT_582692 [Whalleya microplaca]|nr:hypothetical protein F5B20DRAFT_582692 [Whalleya microplaca]